MNISLFLAVSILGASLGLAACSQPQTARNPSTGGVSTDKPASAHVRLAPVAFDAKLSQLPDEQLIDVRTPAEYEGGHLTNATLIDIKSNDFDEAVSQLDKTRPVMVYCAKGGRSTAAVTRLEALGFREVYELEGGLTGWVDAGKSVVH